MEIPDDVIGFWLIKGEDHHLLKIRLRNRETTVVHPIIIGGDVSNDINAIPTKVVVEAICEVAQNLRIGGIIPSRATSSEKKKAAEEPEYYKGAEA